MHRKIIAGATAVAVLLALAACSPSSSPDTLPESGNGQSAPAHVTYIASTQVPGSTQVALTAVPEKMGYFAEENLTVTFQPTAGSTAALQGIASGAGIITNSEVVSTIAAIDSGVPVKAFANIVQNFPWRIAVPEGSDIKSVQDLKGKQLGIISLASGSNLFARAALKSAGLDPDTDVELVPVGADAGAIASLDKGDVQAIALYTEKYAQFEQSAGKKFTYLDTGSLFEGMPSITFTATVSALNDATERDILIRFARAAFKGLLFSAANPTAALKMGYEVYPEMVGSGSIEEALETGVPRFEAWLASATPATGSPADWKDWGAISNTSWDKVFEYASLADQLDKNLPIDQIWTSDLLKEINNFDSAAVLKQAAEAK